MNEIKVPKIQGDTLSGQLVALYKTLQQVNPTERNHFNLEDVQWACPLLILPLCSYISATGATFAASSKLKSYLDTIKFPAGVDSVPSFQQQVQSGKTYVPISVLLKDNPASRERLETLFLKMVFQMLGGSESANNAVFWPITELVTNIFDHSKQDKGFVFAQRYPKKDYLDICIVDHGRGLSATYLQEQNINLSANEAIKAAMEGRSTKPDKQRGYGLRTAKQVVCKAPAGGFVTIGAIGAFVFNRYKTGLLPSAQIIRALWSSVFSGASLWFGYLSYDAVMWMFQKRFYNLYNPHIVWPSSIQFWTFAISIFLLGDFVYRGLHKDRATK